MSIDSDTVYGTMVVNFLQLLGESLLEADQYAHVDQLRVSNLLPDLLQGHIERFEETVPRAPDPDWEYAIEILWELRLQLMAVLQNPDLQDRWWS